VLIAGGGRRAEQESELRSYTLTVRPDGLSAQIGASRVDIPM
jgi:hypothetical protein